MSLGSEYFLFVSCSALGFIQAAAIAGGLRGLLFSQNRLFARLITGALIAPGAIIFFTWNYRNPVGIIEGSQQAGLFSLAALSAIAITIIVSSLLNHSRLKTTVPVQSGLEALKERTYFQALSARLKWRR
ncbi:hypothetical protein Dform_01106 [Dehalogenimonas formicexedens]|uniref:Uncharacterized protein n=1 Tax=Dehalogenimonas formicexedens TaxID=1839801 RepID=A0A1P8F7L5_9CHLR|nr:hypothetical protein [Dehalogenimonas formicexedens]APV44440.1 hypothetical protein Dform_01106 [Dehalogenimonas formicexedens]